MLFVYKYILPIYYALAIGLLIFSIVYGLVRISVLRGKFLSVERPFILGFLFGLVISLLFWIPSFFMPQLMMKLALFPYSLTSLLVPGQFLTTYAGVLWSQKMLAQELSFTDMPLWILYGGYYAPLVTGFIYGGIFSLVGRVVKR